MKPREVLAMCREKEVKAVDLRFADFLGAWQHFTIPVGKLEEDTFEDGLGFDGSSIRGWQAINESDMLARAACPTRRSSIRSPRSPRSSMICNIQDPITREDYSRDPRNVARKAVNYLKSTGIADTCFIGPEAEFFVFDDVRFDQNAHEGYFHLDSVEARVEPRPRRAAEPRLQAPAQGGLLPLPAVRPADGSPQRDDADDDPVRASTSRRSTTRWPRPGSARSTCGSRNSVRMADQMCLYKYIVRERRPPARQDRHLHAQADLRRQRLRACTPTSRSGRRATRCSPAPATPGSREMALHAIGGILRHAPALLAITNPTTNSYKRLVPGYEAPVNLAYSQRNRSASCRIPMYSASPKTKRIEFRCPDPTCNPYLAFAAILMAAIDGIQNKLHPGRAARPRHLRPAAGGAGEGAQGAGLARRGPRRPRARPRVPAARRRVHRGRDRHLDPLQAARRKSSRCACGRIRTSSACITTRDELRLKRGQRVPFV